MTRIPTLATRQLIAAMLALAACTSTALRSAAQFSDTTPSQAYYLAIEELYEGDYRDAYRAFKREWNGAIKSVSARWIDSIAYHAMLGETLYHQGNRSAALDQFNFAANMYLQYPDWLLQVSFDQAPRLDQRLARRVAPWGVSSRQSPPAYLPSTMKISQGRIDNTDVVRRGGVLQRAQYWQINVVEILKAIALTIERRNELLGPLASHDAISKDILARLSKGGAPPNHWSNAWIDVLRGMAHAGLGEVEQAQARLDRGLLLGGRFDHPLTGYALLELGRLAMRTGDAAAAANLFAEAGFSAYRFEDLHLLDESFRYYTINRLASRPASVNPAAESAVAWANRKRFDHIASRIRLGVADELISLGDVRGAAPALTSARAKMNRDIVNGVLGNEALFVAARVEYASHRETAPATLAQALDGQATIAAWNLQIALANQRFDSRALSSRAAVDVYSKLLRDPSPQDTLLRPFASLAVMTTSHADAFDRWLAAVLERRDLAAAVEIADRAKRRRFHNLLDGGGRLAAVRDLLTAAPDRLQPDALQQQNDVLQRFPQFAAANEAARSARADLQTTWFPPLDDEGRKQTGRLWKEYADGLAARESLLTQIALDRAPADYAFPPLRPTTEIQAELEPGQAVMVFHETPRGMLGFLFTNQDATHWNCGPTGRLTGPIAALLRELGNNDANREVTAETLTSDEWVESSAKVYDLLTKNSLFDPTATQELVIVPDGVLWYVPFEALVAASAGPSDQQVVETLSALTPIRYAPTVALAFSNNQPWRRVQRTGLHVGEMMPGDTDEHRAEHLQPLREAVPSPVDLTDAPVASPLAASVAEWLVVLDDVETRAPGPLAWAPLPVDRNSEQGTLAQWLALAGTGPQRIVMPGMHTPAERGGKTSRRQSTAAPPGQELFLASCTLMAAGAETVLMSRWRVGGQSTLDLTRELLQELPFTAPAAAWQRCIQIAADTPVDPVTELRVKADRKDVQLTASHPFFWAGYLVVDSGGRPPAVEVADDADAPADQAPPADDKQAGLVPPAGR